MVCAHVLLLHVHSYLASLPCLFVALIGHWQQQQRVSCATGLTATDNLTLAIRAFDISPAPFSYQPHQGPCLTPPCLPSATACPSSAGQGWQGGGVGVVRLVCRASCACVRASLGGHSSWLYPGEAASQPREGGRAASHRCANPNPPPPNPNPTQHHLPTPNQPQPTWPNTIPTSHCQFPDRSKPQTNNINLTQEKLPVTNWAILVLAQTQDQGLEFE